MKKITPKLNVKFSSLAESLGVSIIGNTFFFNGGEKEFSVSFLKVKRSINISLNSDSVIISI